MKKRLFAILMALTLVLTFMPAMAFADSPDGWYLDCNGYEQRIQYHDSAYLQVWASPVDEEGYVDTSTIEFRWLNGEDLLTDWQTLSEDYEEYEAYETGTYIFEAREKENPEIQDSIEFNVREWSVPTEDEYTIFAGDSITLDATASGDYVGTLTYQWHKRNPETDGWENIPGETKPTLIVSKEGDYKCTATETYDGDSWSLDYYAYVYSDNERSWWAYPKDDKEYVGLNNGKASLEVVIDSEGYEGSYTYSWSKWEDSGSYAPIPGANGKSLVVTETGEYRCYIKDTKGGDYANVYFTVDAWTVSALNYEIEIYKDGEGLLELVFDGEVPTALSYNWLARSEDEEELVEIEGENGNTLKVNKAGSYRCRITDEESEDTREVDFIVTQLAHNWKAMPKSEDVELKIGKTALLEVVVEGDSENLKYQWCTVEYSQFEDSYEPVFTEIEGATSDKYNASVSGEYVCKVYGEDGEEPEEVWFCVDEERITENGVTYYLVDDHSVATYGSERDCKGAVTIRSQVKFSDGKTYPVLFINGFEDCTKLTSVTLPETATMIGYAAFVNTGLKSITIPASVTDIERYAVGYNCIEERIDTGNVDEDGDPIYDCKETYTKVPGFVIFGKTGSAAQKYAAANGFTFRDPAAEAQASAAAAKAADHAKTKPGTVATVSGATVKVVTNVSGATPGTVAYTKAPNKKNVTVPATVAINGKTFKVTQITKNAFKNKKIRTVTVGANVNNIEANAFKGSKATKMILKTKLLKKAGVRKSLKGSKIKTIQVKVGSKKVNKKFVKSYKKIFTKKIAGKKATVK